MILGLCISGRTGSTILTAALNSAKNAIMFGEQKNLLPNFTEAINTYNRFGMIGQGHERLLEAQTRDRFEIIGPSRDRLLKAMRAFYETFYAYDGMECGYIDLYYEHTWEGHVSVLEAIPETKLLLHTRNMRDTYASCKGLGWEKDPVEFKDKYLKRLDFFDTLTKKYGAIRSEYERLSPSYLKAIGGSLGLDIDEGTVGNILGYNHHSSSKNLTDYEEKILE